jgi:hypothetical protein
MGRIAKCLAVLLLSAAPAAAEPAPAQSGSGVGPLGRIRCAAASDLCAWKRIPGLGWQGFESRPVPRVHRRPGITPR